MASQDGSVSFSDADCSAGSDAESPVPVTPKKAKKRQQEDGGSGKKPSNPKPRMKVSPKGKVRKADKPRPGRHQQRAAVGKAGKKKCSACAKDLPLENYALNQTNCVDCKKILDVVSKKCRAAGKTQWLKNVKANPQRLKQLINSYKAALLEAKKNGNKKCSWNVITYIESIKATSAVQHKAQGKMMWEDEAVQWWQRIEGGSLTKAAAEAKWKSMVESAEEDETVTDMLGPAKAPFRMRIHVADMVDFTNSYERSKFLSSNVR